MRLAVPSDSGGSRGCQAHYRKVVVDNCATEEEAKRIGKSIVNSPLVKTAIYGGDPNWGADHHGSRQDSGYPAR